MALERRTARDKGEGANDKVGDHAGRVVVVDGADGEKEKDQAENEEKDGGEDRPLVLAECRARASGPVKMIVRKERKTKNE